jgi:hypothetical protein
MCQRTQCVVCGKPTYAGCGRHIEAVLGDVPVEKRCKCREEGKDPSGPSFISRLMGVFNGK